MEEDSLEFANAEIKRLRNCVKRLEAEKGLQPTEVNVYPVKGDKKTKAMARVKINHVLQLTGLKIIDSVNGYFLAYPTQPKKEGDDEEKFFSIFYPTDKDLRERIEIAVLTEYQKVTTGNPKAKKAEKIDNDGLPF